MIFTINQNVWHRHGVDVLVKSDVIETGKHPNVLHPSFSQQVFLELYLHGTFRSKKTLSFTISSPVSLLLRNNAGL